MSRRFFGHIILVIACFSVWLAEPGLADAAPPYITGGVYSINLNGDVYPQPNGKALSARMECHANALKAAVQKTGVDWDFIATQEYDKPLLCYFNGQMMRPAACLAEAIRGKRKVSVHTYGQGGLIINADSYDVMATYEKYIGHWELTANRVRSKFNGKTFIVGSTHIRTGAAYFCQRRGEIDSILAALDQWKQPSDLAAIIAGDFNCQENLHWGTDPGWTSCPDWRDIGLSRTGNDLKLCRYIAKSFANVSGTYDKDMVLARNDNQPWGNPMGGGKVPNNWNDQSCSDHDIVYAGFMIGCSCPKDQFCFGSINSGQCKPCPPCEPGRCGKGCRICTCPTGQYCDTQGYCQLLGQSCTYNAQCKYGCWQRHCWPGPCYVGQKVCCGGDICTTKSTCPKCP